VLDKNGNEVADAPGIQLTVLLLHDLLDYAAGYLRKLLGEPVHYPGQRPHLFAYSHRESLSQKVAKVKS
jgi:hypothetical protein